MKEIDAVRRIKNRSDRLQRFLESDSPEIFMEKERELLMKAIQLWLNRDEEALDGS